MSPFSLKNLFAKKKEEEIIPERVFEEESINVKDIVAPPYIGVAQDHIKLGERLAKSFFIFSYPRYLNTGWLSPVINLNTPMDISFFIHPISNEIILKKLRKKLTEVSSEIMEREEKGLIRDPELQTAYVDIEMLRDKLMTAQEKMFRFGLYLTVYEQTPKALRETELALRSIFESRLIYIKPALFRQKEGFISCSPYGLDLIGVHTAMDTEPLSTAFPFISFDLSSNEGILYGVNRHNNSLVLFDRFSLENANSVVFAKSGSGKSLRGSEPVLVKNKGAIQLTKIGPLIEKLIKKHGITKIDDELEGVVEPKIRVFSFDKNLKGEWSKVTVAARKKATDVFYKFKTRSGREITTTGDHNMLILKNGAITVSKSSEVIKGEYVPLPRNVSTSSSPIKFLNLLEILKKSKNVYVAGGENLIKKNYQILKKSVLNKKLDKYLYKYREDRVIPIDYFWKILDFLKIKSTYPILKDIKIVSKNGEKKCTYPVNFPTTTDFLKVLGLICAEGTITERAVMISNIDTEVLRALDTSFKKCEVPFFYGNKGIIISSRIFIEIIKALGGKNKSGQKKVLPFIFNLEKEKIASYISGYFEGDGGVEKGGICAVSKSKKLISEIAYLLFYFGIIGRTSKTKKKPTNCNWKRKKLYWKLTISGQDNLRKFAQNINFISERKRKQLSEIIQKEGNTNVDVIPGLELIFQEIYQLFGFQLHEIPEISGWKRGVRHPSPQNLQKIITKIEERIQNFKNSYSTFKSLRELPDLNTVISLGKNNKELNRALWQSLGQSWRVVKNEGVNPFSKNAFKMIEVVNGKSFFLPEIKNALYLGFQEMDLPVKYYNRSLQTALIDRPTSNICYETLHKSAQFIWQNYQDVLINKIPQVEEKLAQLKILANSELFWDPIAKIEKIANTKEKYVYDLTVDNEVFLAGQGGMFVHNSYAIKVEILRYLMQGIDVIVIDPENEYEFLADAAGGAFFKISLTSPNQLNPFDLPIPGEDENKEDILRSNIINLVGLLRIMLGGLTPEEDSIIDQALAETYAIRDITAQSDPKTWQENIPLLSDFEEVLESMAGAESLVIRLKKFTKGTYADFFNQRSNITMDKNMVVFGIRDMEESLRPMAIYIIMRYIWNVVRSKLKKRIMVVDEAWWMMQNEDSASFLFGLAKRARKYWLGVTTITQDVADFMKSEYGQPIITNSSLQLLLKQAPATIDILQKTFDLTEQEKYILLEAAVGEGIFFAGRKHIAISIVASPTEDQIITSSPQEVLRIREARKKLAGAQ